VFVPLAEDEHGEDKGLWEPRPDEKFYVLVFGSQSQPKIARLTHTWVTFVRVKQHGEAQGAEIDYHIISWLPTTLEVRTFRFRVEPGYNLHLYETLQTVLKGVGARPAHPSGADA